jgi:hypothetical protein
MRDVHPELPVIQRAYDFALWLVPVLNWWFRRAEGENAHLRAEKERLLGQLATWAYNASMHGLDKEKLNRTLPSVDRDQTRVVAPKTDGKARRGM